MPVPVRSAGRLAAALLVAAVVLAACSGERPDDAAIMTESEAARIDREPTAFHGTLLDPAVERPELTLRDTGGRVFALAERPRDEVSVVFFGYTHCPDVCPTTMADLAAARRQLPAGVREQVTVAFVTEDPARDTPAVLRDWLDGFDPDFVGLLGGNEQTKHVLEELYLPASRRIPSPTRTVLHPADGHEHPGDYGLEHASIVYAFAPGGATVIYTGGVSPRQYAEDLARLAAW